MEIVYFIIGLLVASLAAYFAVRGRRASSAALLEGERKTRAEEKQEHKEQLEACKRDASEQRARELAEIRQNYELQLSQLRTSHEQQIDLLKKSYEQQLALFKAEVTTATEKLLKERSGELQQTNTQKMDELFRPLRDNIQRMEQSMQANREATVQSQTRFEDAMRQMMQSNERLGNEADRLSNALLRKNKVAGNWGELILTELLENQGLVPGTHFDIQQTIRDDSGRTIYNDDTGSRMIPDVIIHLGDNREVIIDSKMSLTAFVDYQNADDENTRQTALRQHIDSVRAHVKELSAKDYSAYIARSRKSIDFVIMFVPIDAALQLALSTEPTLWREAFDRKVFIASGQTLTAALHIIRLTWINIQQERNTQRVMDEARKLIDRVARFYDEFLTVGTKLNEAAKAYDAVEKRVSSGRLSILSIGNHLEDMGARGKKPLPRLDSAEDYVEDFEELTADE